jgi:CDP-glycerol glycerophosphotransferase (TagB/SpsB family)
MSEAPPDRVLQNLGLSKDRPYVVWMPTFREVYRGMLQSWVDAEALSNKQHLQEKMARFRKCIESSDLDFRVKLHPMDADSFEGFQKWQISTADLLEAGTTLYSFLGGASGMISDYSGVWVEYLALDRPLLLFCPDAGSYSIGRGFKDPNMMEIAAELITSKPAEVREFFQSIRAGEDWRPQARRRVRSILEPSSPGQIADRLVDVVNVAALRKGLDVELSTK